MSDTPIGNVTQGRFIRHLEEIRQLAAQDRDIVIIATGAERAGKSGLADVAAEYLDPGLVPELQVHWSGRSYAEAAAKKVAVSGRWLQDALEARGWTPRVDAGDLLVIA